MVMAIISISRSSSVVGQLAIEATGEEKPDEAFEGEAERLEFLRLMSPPKADCLVTPVSSVVMFRSREATDLSPLDLLRDMEKEGTRNCIVDS